MNWFDVYPKSVLSGKESIIKIRPRYADRRFPAEKSAIKITYHPYDCVAADDPEKEFHWTKADAVLPESLWDLSNGELIIKMVFAGEQEHRFCIEYEFEEMNEAYPVYAKKVVKFAAAVYSLKEDLYSLRPYKGDLHIHSFKSDGQKDPRYVAARYREEGFDFAAITDHKQYQPSLDTIAYWEGKKSSDFVLYPGEEVHTPDNNVHIINFAGKKSVNTMYREDEDAYRKEVAEYMKNIPGEDKVEGANLFEVAASEWAFDKIRENGGLAVYCHPYWKTFTNVLPEALVSNVFKRRKFDALELIGGFSPFEQESLNFQVVRYMEERMTGSDFPVVGSSDSHGTDTFDATPAPRQTYANPANAVMFSWYYTIIFAEENTAESLVENVKKFHSVAVCAREEKNPDVYGNFRLIKYTHFLLREYFPLLTQRCKAEGLLMQEYLATGDENILKALKALDNQTGLFREKCFGKS